MELVAEMQILQSPVLYNYDKHNMYNSCLVGSNYNTVDIEILKNPIPRNKKATDG